jgi:hypothetical protein
MFLSIGLVFAKSRSVTRQSNVDTQSTIDAIIEMTSEMVAMSGFISIIIGHHRDNSTIDLDPVLAAAQAHSDDLLAQKNFFSMVADPSTSSSVLEQNSASTAALKKALSITVSDIQQFEASNAEDGHNHLSFDTLSETWCVLFICVYQYLWV